MVARFSPESPLVSAEWLKGHLTAPDVRVLDATYITSFRPGEAQTGGEVCHLVFVANLPNVIFPVAALFALAVYSEPA